MKGPVLFRHIKRGREYVVLNAAELQSSAGAPPEGTVLAIYAGTDDGKVWARPMAEFLEADRFEPISGTTIEFFQRQAEQLVYMAARHGFVITIEQQPKTPLAMGNHESIVSIRESRNA